jgi:hypothetical protein
MNPPQFIFEINTRVWLRTLGNGKRLTLADVPNSCLDEWAARGYDAIWLMGVWMPSAESRRIAFEHMGLRDEYWRALPGWKDNDVVGSPFAHCGFQINPAIGTEAELAQFRTRLAARGMRLILDFIPNHTATDHPWIHGHTDWYVNGTEADVVAHPERWFWIQTKTGPRAIAYGRDPYFPPWTDTAQLDYFNPELQKKMCAELLRISGMCDGVRCDMAMLELASVFEQVWGHRPDEFWPEAVSDVKRAYPDFCFIAEVYWGLDGDLRQMGFDLTYDKQPLDVIVHGQPLRRELFDLSVAGHRRRLRFLENHDEPRIASRLDPVRHLAAATWLLSLPSSRLIFEGQTEGKKVKLPVQLAREPEEPVDPAIQACYATLLGIVNREIVRRGTWLLLLPREAWFGNDTHQQILAQSYTLADQHLLVVVNWSEKKSQCWVNLPLGYLAGMEVELRDLLSSKVYTRNGVVLMLRGLYLDMEPWEAHIFQCVIRPTTEPEV